MPASTENPTAAAAQDRPPSVSSESCLVQTTIGPVEGFIDPSFPRVRTWLGVPFAEPPVGDRRFAPPEAKKPIPEGEVLSATKMPPAPMQAVTTKPDIYAKHVPEFLATGPYSEDCLYLNVFAPLGGEEERRKEEDPLPTLVFFYGGEGEWGGINAEYLQPQEWVESSQKHIVVLFNWRVGIFGFPNAKGLKDGPIGILDQRQALLFLRDNIQSFGGSPSSIVAFGHAAGSGSIEAHLFAWPDDPIVSAAICISGFLTMGGTNRDMDQQSFSLIARRLGCAKDATPEQEVAFLRDIDAGAILGCFRSYNDSGAEPRMFFRPQVDGAILLTPEEHLDRARQGKFARVPVILGMTADEGNALVPCRELATGEEGATAAAARWTSRIEDAVQQVLGSWMKAYHFAELPMLMGTHEIERGRSTGFQRQLSKTMQAMWVDFARDPERGLTKWGWEPASLDNSSALVLGKDGVLFQQGDKSFGKLALVGGNQKP